MTARTTVVKPDRTEIGRRWRRDGAASRRKGVTDYTAWYERVKTAMPGGLQICSSDMSDALESALRKRGRAEGFGLSIERLDLPYMGSPELMVTLFRKGTKAPGRAKYLARVRRRSVA